MSVLNCDCCGSCDWIHVYRTVVKCRVCDLHSAFGQERRDHGAPVRILAKSAQLRRAEFEAYVDRALRYGERGRWLDVGCGTGELLACAAQHGYEPEGLEVTAARGEASLAAVPDAIVHGRPLEELSLAPESFSVISLINVFSHLPSPSTSFAEIHRLMTTGGVLLLRTGRIDGHGILSRRLLTRTLGDENQWLGTRTLQTYAARWGFAIVETSFTPYLDWVLSAERLRMPSASTRVTIAKAGLRMVPGRRTLLKSVRPLFPLGSLRAVLRKVDHPPELPQHP